MAYYSPLQRYSRVLTGRLSLCRPRPRHSDSLHRRAVVARDQSGALAPGPGTDVGGVPAQVGVGVCGYAGACVCVCVCACVCVCVRVCVRVCLRLATYRSGRDVRTATDESM